MRSWRFYALVASAAVFLLAIGILAALWIYRQSLIGNYTSEAPAAIALADVRAEDRQALRDKWSRFFGDLQSQRPTAPLTMSPPEINAFISMIPQLKDRVHVGIEDNLLRAEFAVPLEDLGWKGRYANGIMLGKVQLGGDGLAEVELVSATLNGKPLPKWLLSQVHKQEGLNIVQRVLRDAKIGRHLKSIEIKDQMLVFNPINAY